MTEKQLITIAKNQYKVGDEITCLETGAKCKIGQLTSFTNANSSTKLWSDDVTNTNQITNALIYSNGVWASKIYKRLGNYVVFLDEKSSYGNFKKGDIDKVDRWEGNICWLRKYKSITISKPEDNVKWFETKELAQLYSTSLLVYKPKIGDWVLTSNSANGWGFTFAEISNKILKITDIHSHIPRSTLLPLVYFGKMKTCYSKILRKAYDSEIPKNEVKKIDKYNPNNLKLGDTVILVPENYSKSFYHSARHFCETHCNKKSFEITELSSNNYGKGNVFIKESIWNFPLDCFKKVEVTKDYNHWIPKSWSSDPIKLEHVEPDFMWEIRGMNRKKYGVNPYFDYFNLETKKIKDYPRSFKESFSKKTTINKIKTKSVKVYK